MSGVSDVLSLSVSLLILAAAIGALFFGVKNAYVKARVEALTGLVDSYAEENRLKTEQISSLKEELSEESTRAITKENELEAKLEMYAKENKTLKNLVTQRADVQTLISKTDEILTHVQYLRSKVG